MPGAFADCFQALEDLDFAAVVLVSVAVSALVMISSAIVSLPLVSNFLLFKRTNAVDVSVSFQTQKGRKPLTGFPSAAHSGSGCSARRRRAALDSSDR